MFEGDDRFEGFILSIDAIHKCINKIKQDVITDESLKGVHSLWLYELLKSDEGLTSAELASRSGIDRSLVSRELTPLIKEGYIISKGAARRGYNSRFTLTEKGTAVARRISSLALDVQSFASSDVSDEQLLCFYEVLFKIKSNLEKYVTG